MKQGLDIKWLCLLVLNLFLLLLIALPHQPSTSKEQDMRSIEQKIVTLQNELSKTQVSPDLTPITQNIKQLGAFIQELQNKDDHQLGELFTTEQALIKKQLEGITELLRHLEEQKHPIKMLPQSQLPFQVLSIDSIQEIPVASLRYHYKTQALEQGDALAGWKVVTLDFTKQYIEFENQEKAHIVVRLAPQEVSHA